MSSPARKSEFEATQQTVKFFETLLRASTDGIVITDPSQNIIVANEAFCTFFGQQHRGVIETSLFVWLEQLDSGAPARWAELEQRVRNQGSCRDIEFRLATEEKGFRYLSVNASLLEQVADEELGVIISIWHDITVRKQAEKELEKYREHLEELVSKRAWELETANKELSEYARVVSHDLRAPLRAIRQYADFLKNDLGTILEADQKEYLDGMMESVADADGLVSDLLNLSHVGRKMLPTELINMGEFLKEICEMFASQNIVVEMNEDWPSIKVEPVVFRMIFQNLISNGVKFNESLPIRLELGWREPDAGHWAFCVRDNGIGIEARFHEQIFKVFERLHTKEEYEGTGIGLAIVNKAVNILQGTIHVESKPGEGSAFYVTLPKT